MNMIPKYEEIMLPFLEYLADGIEVVTFIEEVGGR